MRQLRSCFGTFGLLLWLLLSAAPAGAWEVPAVRFVPGDDHADAPRIDLLAGREDPLAVAFAVPPKPQEIIHLLDVGLPEDFDWAVGPVGYLAQEPAEKHPQPTHTGFAALVYDTGSDFKAFPRRKSTWVILGIGAGAAALAHPADDDINDRLVGSKGVSNLFAAGRWIGSLWVQASAATGLYVIGRYVMPHAEGAPKTNKVSHLGFDMLRALIVSQAFTQGIKYAVRRDRPTGECCAFPSGHASATFATASVLERHLGYRGAWPTFAVAAYVATSRLHDNKHFLSDVLFGGALGMASGWTVVGRHGRSEYALVPMPVKGGVAVTLVRKTSQKNGVS